MAYTLKLNGDKVKGLSIMTNNGLQDVKTVKQGNDVLWEMEKVATPVISCSNNVVTMTCSTAGATIKYSTNGGSSYSTYSSAITISATTTYMVFAVKSGMLDSETTTYTATYVVLKLPTPTVTKSTSGDKVTLTIKTSGVSGVKYYIRKKTGGSANLTCSSITDPTTSSYSTTQTGSGNDSSTTVTFTNSTAVYYGGIKVFGTKSGYTNSDIKCYTTSY